MKRTLAIIASFVSVAALVAAIATAVFIDRPLNAVRDLASEVRARLIWAVTAGSPDIGNAMIAMRDGTMLATDVYLPAGEGAVPTVLMRLPYDKSANGQVRFWVQRFNKHGFAVAVQDMRGRYRSQGTFAPYPNEGADGATTIDWIVRQAWSNGRVGTLGCSALGESQFMLARQKHPAHRAMIPIAAGGAIGTAGGRHAYFSTFEGGVFNLAAGFGWFSGQGGKTGDRMESPQVDYPKSLASLPLIDMVASVRPDPTDFEAFLSNFDNPGFWEKAGYVSDRDTFATPTLLVDTWHDLGIGSTMVLAEVVRRSVPDTHVIVAPGNHCDYLQSSEPGRVGDLEFSPKTRLDFVDIFVRFLDHWLNDGPEPKLPAYTYYVLAEDVWRESATWPPQGARPLSLYLSSTKTGDLVPEPDRVSEGTREFLSDPFDPVPSVGGPICCTGDPEARAGPLFQNIIEGRKDVLVYTSDVLEAPLRIAGPVSATVLVSTDVPDTDLVVRMTDVDPHGKSLTVQEGALRLRYRDGFDRIAMMQPGEIYPARVNMRDIAYLFRQGHRIRVHIAGSSFPRLERNMNTGGANYVETNGRPATIRIHTSASRPSKLDLLVLPD